MNLRSIALAALAEDAAPPRGGEPPRSPKNPEFEEKHKRGQPTNKGQFRKSEKTLAELDDADAAIPVPDYSDSSPSSVAAEIAAVRARYTNPDGSPKSSFGRAPNGEKSNLNEYQWLLVRTPTFKKWFGDWESLAKSSSGGGRSPISHAAPFGVAPGGSLSARDDDGNVSDYVAPVNPASVSKIVDSNGEPRVVYHGSAKDFDDFTLDVAGRANETESKLGIWFFERRDYAEAFARQTTDSPKIYESFLNIRNPKVYGTTEPDKEAEREIEDEIKSLRRRLDDLKSDYDNPYDNLRQSLFQAAKGDFFPKESLMQMYAGHVPDAAEVIDAAKRYTATEKDIDALTKKRRDMGYTDSYEKMRTDMAATVGASAYNANYMGLGYAYDNKGKAPELFRKKLESEGYDGVVMNDTRFDREVVGGRNTQIVALSPDELFPATKDGFREGATFPKRLTPATDSRGGEPPRSPIPPFDLQKFVDYLSGKED